MAFFTKEAEGDVHFQHLDFSVKQTVEFSNLKIREKGQFSKTLVETGIFIPLVIKMASFNVENAS